MLKSLGYILKIWILVSWVPVLVSFLLGLPINNLYLIVFTANVLFIAYFARFRNKNFENFTNKSFISKPIIFYSIILGFTLKFGLNPLFNFDSILGYFDIGNSIIFFHPKLLDILIVVILGPISEEIIYRFIVFKKIINLSSNPWLAILLSSVLFSVIHWTSINLVLMTFVMGMFLSYIFWKTKNIWVPIICHVTMNSIAIFYEVFFQQHYISILQKLDFGFLYWMICLISLLMSIMIIRILISKIAPPQNKYIP
ncbi:CPBP family intramembrane glutamic endopeptidase [Maribacter aestuarii]|uniref:CPBP family intramembrane glutamic endopeptidase n=1 Tax=Maribacter aestuarii TaxID=1130723 RepID=UPI0025A5C4F2|nr:type II CAAX endopeptidase family protein [Maribacter aestuarii]